MVNVLIVILSGFIAMVIGALWYSPLLFGNLWMTLSKLTYNDMDVAKKKGMTHRYIGNFIAILITAYVLAWLIEKTGESGLIIAISVWIGFFVTTLLTGVLWEEKSYKLYLLNIAHYLVILLLIGFIIGKWG